MWWLKKQSKELLKTTEDDTNGEIILKTGQLCFIFDLRYVRRRRQ